MYSLYCKGFALAALVVGLTACTAPHINQSAASAAAYHYEVNLRRLDAQRRLRVRVELPPTQTAEAVYVVPKLVPGIYGALNFGQYIADFAAFDAHGHSLTVTRQDTNSWRIADARRLHHLTYAVAATWPEFRTAKGQQPPFYRSAGSSYHPDSAFVLNYSTFTGYLEGQANQPYEVRFMKPAHFYGASHLTPQPVNDTIDLVRAPTYRELVDAPILYARPDTAWLRVGTTQVLVALYDAPQQQPYARVLANSLRTMLEAQRAYLGGTLPVDQYAFLLYHTAGPKGVHVSDGLEHNHSTLCLLESAELAELNRFVQHIASHEFFHIVTPLNIHAEQIEQYDFRQPAFSRHLWFYEGLTEYATIHMPIRGGQQKLPEFLTVLTQKAKQMRGFDDALPLTQLSQQAGARQDQYYNFYLKGALFNLCLDVRLRELSAGKMGTQQLTQQLLRRYGVHRPFRDDQFLDVLTEMTYPQMRAFFHDYLETGRPLPLAETLAKVGLTYDPASGAVSLAAQSTAGQLALRRAWIGQ